MGLVARVRSTEIVLGVRVVRVRLLAARARNMAIVRRVVMAMGLAARVRIVVLGLVVRVRSTEIVLGVHVVTSA